MVSETWKGNSAGKQPNQGDTGVRVFQVVTYAGSTADDVKSELFDSTGVQQNVAWDDDTSWLICQSITMRRSSPIVWDVVASYAVSPTGFFEPTANPLDLPWRYLWEPIDEPIPFDRDTDNNPVLNSAYDPPSSPPTKYITKWGLRIKHYVSFFDFATFKQYNNTVNSDSIDMTQPNGNSVTFEAGTIFCKHIRPTHEYSANDAVIEIEKVFEIYDLSELDITDPHQLHFLDEGTNGWYTNGGVVTKGSIVFRDGSVPSGNVALNGFGVPVDSTLMISPYQSGGAVQNPVEAPHLAPQGATVEPSGSEDFPAVFLRYKRYQSIAMLPIMAPS